MPLKAHFPVIDDRRYADIVAEARTRIPRYTPEWTDVGESDPGFTLVELFAWLTEMQLYRMSKVPELNYLKFLELVGIELAPARPAVAEITLPVQDNFAEPYVIVPARTQVSTEEPDDQGPIIFETDWALTALSAKLNAIQAYDGFMYKDVSQDNEEASASFDPFGSQANAGSALLLGFESGQAFPSVTFNLTFWVPQSGNGAAAVRCTTDDRQLFVSASLAWEYWNGKEWRALNVLKDETNVLTRSGHVHIKTPEKGAMVRSVIGKIPSPRYWIRARVSRTGYQEIPRLLAVRSNTVTATQAETIEAEVVGGSNGRPDQVVTLANTPVLAGSLVLQVDEGQGFQTWGEVDDFFSSTRDKPHYVLNCTTGEIRFGGPEQRIPVANPNNPANFLALEYRVGGGKRGNVVAGAINALLTTISGVDANAVGNLQPSYGGSTEETIEQATKRAPQVLKSRDRAVTSEDFELLALRAANIARAKALPLYHPDFLGVEVPGVVSVIIVPDLDDNPAPMPSAGTLKTVCAYLNERRLLTTEVYVLKPTYQEVVIKAELIADDDADLAEVKLSAEDTITQYFHPLRGGKEGLGWPFGGDIYYSLVYSRLLVNGVQRVEGLTIELDGEAYPACQDVSVPAGVLLKNGSHDLQVRYDFTE